ncbi:MAG: hypothetical protein P8R42_25405 [Candidatus Binatia bacterium]|nr:hypothetical protein [Candidatus Binatia bacterium]
MARATKSKVRKRPPASARRRGSAKDRAKEEKLEALIAELRTAAESIGIRVRRERLLREVGYHVRSGLCRVDDQEILLVESELAPDIQVDLLLGALSGRDLSGVPLSEEVLVMIRGGEPVPAQ